jgi:hypothetical protein
MTPRRAAQSRVSELRRAARGWRKAGVIDASTLTAIEAAYPDGRLRLAAAWKVLIFVVVSVAVNAVLFGFEMVSHRSQAYGSWLTFAAILALATEGLLRSERIGENGSAAATSFWAAVYAMVGAAFLFLGGESRDAERAETVVLLVATVVFAAACWHWGFEAYGAFAAVAFFFLLARFPGGRLWWAVAGVLLVLAAARGLDRAALPPPLRRACAGILAVSGLALYTAFNRYALDERLIESVAGNRAASAQPWRALEILSPLAMTAIPLLFIAWGLHDRRLLLLDLGAVLAALSLVTLRYYVHLAPLWLVLAAAGAGVVVAALVLNRRLRRAPNGEWAGFTARPLYGGRSTAGLATAAVVAAYAPDAGPATAPAREGGGFTPGGGRFGGGGATGSF